MGGGCGNRRRDLRVCPGTPQLDRAYSALMRHFLSSCLAVFVALPLWAASSAQIQIIDQMALAIDRTADELHHTSTKDCQQTTCVTTLSYWGSDGKLLKVVEEKKSALSAGTLTARYYSNCRLFLARSAPLDPKVAKDRSQIAKYYFRKGKLVEITFGGDPKTFPKEQWAFYERTQRVEPQSCSLK